MSELETLVCGGCGIAYAVPTPWLKARRDDGKQFYCPNGCTRVFRESTTDRLRRSLDKQIQENARLADAAAAEQKRAVAAEARARTAETTAKRLRTRIQAGVCPDCNRTFADLARHMASKHRCDPVAPPSKPAGKTRRRLDA
jgi:NMD protein affecting ribosome stability and mRNA decay